jgi:5-methylcytosine-specific restriction enzyme subunit McrC
VPSPIRIANIYFLLSYAWNHWAEGDMADVSELRATDTTNLLAFVLDAGTRHALRRGLHRDYQRYVREIPGVRGRLLITESKRRLLFEHGRAACAIGELDHASVPNRILKSTLQLLHAAECLDSGIRDQLAHTLRQMRQIPEIRLDAGLFRRVRINRSNAHYTFLLSLCELAFDCLLPNPGGSETRFRDFAEDDAWMHALFEDFVRNFYHTHADSFGWACLGRTRISWDATPRDSESAALLPGMTTDVALERDDLHLIVDCKYYADALHGRYTPKLDSDNLYQIWSYVSQHRRSHPQLAVQGLLLYPTVQQDFTADYMIDGNRVRAATVNLDADWTDIRSRLLALLA